MCIGAIVKTIDGRQGGIIAIDHKNKIAVLQNRHSCWTEHTAALKVISYAGCDNEDNEENIKIFCRV